jgi:dTDP-4-amino-4,6-dideoxygalactose transaminase
MLTTDDDRLAERARVMRLHGISRDVFDRYRGSKPSWEYEVIAPGFKYNLTDVAAAIGLHQLRRADEMWARRERIALRYMKAFAHLPLQLPSIRQAADRHAWHLFVVQLDTRRLAIDRDTFIRRLSERGVGTSVHFIPLHRQPYWRDTYGLRAEQFPQAEAAFQRVVSLPMYSAMSNDEVEYVVDAVTDVLAAGVRG